MNKRPDLKVGDVVRLSHKGEKIYGTQAWAGTAMTVVRIPARAQQDGRDRIYVAVNHTNSVTHFHRVTKMSFRRKELWFTGHNIADAGKSFSMYKTTAGQPRLSMSGVQSLAKHGFSMGASVAKPKLPDPCKKDEVQCSKCGRMADRGHACWWCGQQN
jgi:hypothetical protein